MAGLPPSNLCIAYGTRGVDKLIETLEEKDAATQRSTLTTLNTLLSTQESKLQALAFEKAPLVPTLGRLLGSEDDEVKRQSALALASLALIYQGRLAISDAGTVAELSSFLVDSADTGVRAACSNALLALSEVCAPLPLAPRSPACGRGVLDGAMRCLRGAVPIPPRAALSPSCDARRGAARRAVTGARR